MRPKSYEPTDEDIALVLFCVQDVSDRTVPEARTPYLQAMTRLRSMKPVLPIPVETPLQEELPIGSSGTGSS